MNTDDDVRPVAASSKRQLTKTTLIALLVAAGILVTTVLPAEYGLDPLGTGAVLGLMPLSGPPIVPEEVAVPAGALPTPVQEGPVAHYPVEYKFDAVEFTLGPYDYLEYKYQLERGAAMMFSWTASGALIHDFHGERIGAPSASAESFKKADTSRAHGSFTAPFAGIHGWYWENPGGEPVSITLTTTGFYSAAVEIRSDRTRHPHELRSMETVIGAIDRGAAAIP
ncbi:MAG: hypothetical protein A3G25_00015 [Betaproteobacteria bacterium RIFCSPLOWO2_12_FULL_63_13]|nr:MAG: hypothetical protein A3G25_00015 [Betaproteobacteria bacterium RIFCSPLOWO2_12_FULL_63_13]